MFYLGETDTRCGLGHPFRACSGGLVITQGAQRAAGVGRGAILTARFCVRYPKSFDIDNHLIAIVVLYTGIGTLSRCGIVIVGVGDA